MKFYNKYRKYYEAAGEGGDPGGSTESQDDQSNDDESQETDDKEEPSEQEGEQHSQDQDQKEDQESKPFYAEAENWRDDIVNNMKDAEGNPISEKESKKALNILNRYNTFDKYTEAFFNQHDKIRAGKLSDALPKDATEEQVKEWREANGIPTELEKYEPVLEDGLILGDEDKAIMDEVKSVAFEANMKPEQLGSLASSMLNARAKQAELINQRDIKTENETMELLNERWGGDFTANSNAIANALNGLPSEGDGMDNVSLLFQNARMPNGVKVLHDPQVVDWLSSLARKANPMSTLSTGGDTGSVTSEIEALENKMGTPEYTDADRKRYAELQDAVKGN